MLILLWMKIIRADLDSEMDKPRDNRNFARLLAEFSIVLSEAFKSSGLIKRVISSANCII